MMTSHTTLLAAIAAPLAGPAVAEGPGDRFIIHEMDQPPEAAAAQVRSHTENEDDWLLLAACGLPGGGVAALKICYPAIGPDIVAVAMHTFALLPCGHLAYHQEHGQSMPSMLEIDVMTTFELRPRLKDTAATARPAIAWMRSDVPGLD